MNLRWLFAGLIFSLMVFFLGTGCNKKGGEVVVSGSNVVNVKVVSAPPAADDMLGDPVWDGVEEVAIRAGESADFTDQFGIRLVRVKAVTDGVDLYMRFNWTDSTESQSPGYWKYAACDRCRVWSQNADTANGQDLNNALTPKWANEDILAMFIDYGNNGSEKANCATTCHDPNVNTIGSSHWPTGGGNIDCWIWRAGRTAPLGLAEDLFLGPEQKYDLRSVEIYQRNAVDDTSDRTDPRWMHRLGHSDSVSFLYVPDTVQLDWSAPAGWVMNDGVPGYVLQPNWHGADTSAYDVKSKSDWDGSTMKWTVVMWRKLKTAYTTEDVDFTDSRKEYQATLAIMDHTNSRHSGSKPFTIKFQ
jgi:hypothetical protein